MKNNVTKAMSEAGANVASVCYDVLVGRTFGDDTSVGQIIREAKLTATEREIVAAYNGGVIQSHEAIYLAMDAAKNADNAEICAVTGCDTTAVRMYGGRPHCNDCLPPFILKR